MTIIIVRNKDFLMKWSTFTVTIRALSVIVIAVYVEEGETTCLCDRPYFGQVSDFSLTFCEWKWLLVTWFQQSFINHYRSYFQHLQFWRLGHVSDVIDNWHTVIFLNPCLRVYSLSETIKYFSLMNQLLWL